MISHLNKIQRIRLIAWSIITTLLMLAFGCMLFRGIHVNTNLLDLLPKVTQNPIEAQANRLFDNTLGKQVVFLVSNPNKPYAEQSADMFYQHLNTLHQKALFSSIDYRIDNAQQQSWTSFYYPYRLSLLSKEQQTLLQTGNITSIEQQALQRLYSPMSAVGVMLSQDPYGLFQQFMLSLPNPASRLQLIDQRMMTQANGRWYVLIRAQLARSSFSMAEQKQAMQLIDASQVNMVRQYPHTTLLKTGVLFYASAGTEEAEKNISTIGIGSLIGIILLILWIFRSITPLCYILLSSAVGFVAGFVITQALFGSMMLFTLVIGASLIGIAVDYAFFFYADRFFGGSTWQASRGLQHIISGISLGLLNMIVAYLLICLIPFTELKQLAVFSMTGLIMAYATVVCLFPAILKPSPTLRDNLLTRFTRRYLHRWQQMSTRAIVILYMMIITTSLVGLYLIKANDDIHILAAATPQLTYEEAAIDKLIGSHMGASFYVVTGKTPDMTLQHMNTLTTTIDNAFPNIHSRYMSINAYLPTIVTQQNNYQLQTDLLKQHLPSYLQHIGMNPQQAMNIQKQLTQTPFKPLTLNAWLASPVSTNLRYLWLGKIQQQYVGIVMLSKQLPTHDLLQLTKGMHFVTYVNKAQSVSQIFHDYRIKMTWVLLLAYLLLGILLMCRYGLKRGSLLFLPPATACLFMFGVLGILGIPLTLFSILAAILVFGIVVDYVVFFAETKRHYESTMLAVTLSAITALLSFGLLTLSSTMAIHYFGVTVAIGIISGFLLAPLMIRLKPGVHHA